MKKAARITSKGRITVPREMRLSLEGGGDKLLFEKDGGDIHVRALRTKSPFEKYRGIGSPSRALGQNGVVRWVRELRGI